jgi:hypothetical protein
MRIVSLAVKAFLGVVALYIVLFVWPTPYRYYEFPDRTLIIRVNRVTGSQQVLRADGWQ